jgi:predicted DNA-binding transcriptional regulator AlpA
MSQKTNFNDLPGDAFTRVSTLATGGKGQGVVGVSKSTIFRWVAEGLFPAPTKLSNRVTVWRVADIRAWLQSRVQAA